MTDYTISLANAFITTNSPLVLEVAYTNVKSATYTCLTKMSSSEITINFTSKNNIQQVTNNVIQVNVPASYNIYIYDNTAITPEPLLFSFYAYQDLHINNRANLLQIFSQELPTIYQNSNMYNYYDNLGIAEVLSEVYAYIYKLYYNAVYSIGVNGSYNENWELVYIGVHNFLTGAKYPSECIKTLMQMGGNPSMRVQDISIVLSKIMYQYLGQATPISIVHEELINTWHINIYYTAGDAWLLGTSGVSELGVSTYLTSRSSTQSLLWFIHEMSERLMPSYVKYDISYFTYEVFLTDFDTATVTANDYYSPNEIYDAYMTVNNNKNYNTRGYNYV